MAKKRKEYGVWEAWSWTALAVLVLIVFVEATFSLTNAWELSTLTTNLRRLSTGSSVLLEEKTRMAQEAMMEKEEMEKKMMETKEPTGMFVIFTEPETNISFLVDEELTGLDYGGESVSKDGGNLIVTIQQGPVYGEPKPHECKATFTISPRDEPVITKDIVFRNPLYTVTTKDDCGITVDIKK